MLACNGSDSLDSNDPKVVPKVAGSGGLPLVPGVPAPVYFSPQSLELLVGAGREGAGRRAVCAVSSGFINGCVHVR